MPGAVDLGPGHPREPLRILLHEHTIIQNARCVDDTAKVARYGEHAFDIIGIADVCRNDVNFDAGVFQGMKNVTLVIRGNAAAAGKHQVLGATGCQVLVTNKPSAQPPVTRYDDPDRVLATHVDQRFVHKVLVWQAGRRIGCPRETPLRYQV